MPEWGCLKEGSVGRDLESQVEAFKALWSGRFGLCLPGWVRLRLPCPSVLLGREVWVWPGLAEWEQDQGAHGGQEEALYSRRDG